MAIKKILLLSLFVLTVSFLYSQQQEYFREMRFVQRLSWDGDNYAIRYEVVIERNVDGIYRRLMQEYTEEFFVEVSLSAGNYRYQVFPYDYLEQRGAGSGWIEFEILYAFNPEVFSSETGTEIAETETEEFIYSLILNITGRNIHPDAEIFIQSDEEMIFIADLKENIQSGSNIRLTFNKANSIPEEFEVIIKNPGGFETSMNASYDIPSPPPVPAPRVKNFELYMAAAFMPQILFYGDLNKISNKNFTILGLAFRFGFFYLGWNFMQLGAEISAGWCYHDTNLSSVTTDVCLTVRKTLPSGKAAFALRTGAGYSFLSGEINNGAVWQPFHLNTGVSILWMPLKNLYLDAGIDLLFWIKNKNASSALRPFAGFGFKL